ncbi:hypothetical protein ZWY2020_040468 [Hordeum vulgare]|nr:hypothetical protein ZWY2020_040468 [Hordeum vulgare]
MVAGHCVAAAKLHHLLIMDAAAREAHLEVPCSHLEHRVYGLVQLTSSRGTGSHHPKAPLSLVAPRKYTDCNSSFRGRRPSPPHPAVASMAEVVPVDQGKKEEEEFSTGPLSILMLSIKNNTQVGQVDFLPLLIETSVAYQGQILCSTGGWSEVYEGLTFASVRGAGQEGIHDVRVIPGWEAIPPILKVHDDVQRDAYS